MKFLTEAQIEEIKRIGLFDYISNNSHEHSKTEIVEMLREFNYAVYELDKEVEVKATAKMIEELEEEEEEENEA